MAAGVAAPHAGPDNHAGVVHNAEINYLQIMVRMRATRRRDWIFNLGFGHCVSHQIITANIAIAGKIRIAAACIGDGSALNGFRNK